MPYLYCIRFCFLLIFFLHVSLGLFSQSVFFVNQYATGSGNGSSWADACTNLQDALDKASSGDAIWIAAGTYKPTVDASGNGSPADERTKTFQLIHGVSLFGGFDGTEIMLAERDWETNETVLNGDIGVGDDISDNCYHVVTGADSLELNGFTITGGYASAGTTDDGHGGGIFLKNVSAFKLDCCIVKDNIASTGGGGMVVSNCDSIEISNSIFLRDSVSWWGGAIQNGESSLTISNSSFIKNTASLPSRGWGGAVFVVNDGVAHISNCTFTQNTAPRGEAIANYYTTVNEVTVVNSILWQTKEGEIRGDCDVTYSVIRQDAYASNEGCIGDDPLLYIVGDSDLRIHESSTAIDAGDPDFPLDPDDSRADIGAPWTIFSPETELFVADISTSIGQYISGDNEITATITNRGASTVTAMDIEWEVNGVPQTTKNWTGSLESMSTTDPVILGSCNLNFGDNTIKVITANPTPGPDDYTGNDTLQITVDAETNLDIGIVSVVEPLDPFTHGVNDIRILFKNYSNDSTITSADIDFEIDDVAQTTYNWTGTLLPGEISDTVTILANNFFTEANHSIKVWTVDPNSNFDDDNTNDTLQVSVSGCNPLAGGNYTIGSGGDFNTFNDAVNYLTSTCGITGPFVFNVLSDTYNEQVTIPEIPGMSENNTITFQSATGDSTDVILTYAASGEGDNYTLKLDGTDYITFKNITLEATGPEYARVVEIGSNVYHTTFSNNRLLGVANKSELVYSNNNTITLDSCNVFTHNLFSKGIRGINMIRGDYLIVSGNEFVNQTEIAISLTNYLYPEIFSNYIHSDTRLTSAIYLDGCRDQVKINNNQIILPFGGNGLKLEYCRLATTTDTSEVFNNHVYINTEEQNDFGIDMFLYASNVKIFHNTVHINGNNPSSSCYYFGSSDPFSFKLLNNNLVNSAGGYVIYRSPNYFGMYTSNYNNLYTNGEIFVKYRWSSVADFNAWQTDYGQDLNSVSVYPYFLEDTSYHVLHPALNGAGTPLTEVTKDLDGESRDAINSDIGADEFTHSPVPLNGIYTIAGTLPDYETINDAVQALTINGIDGAVTFNIASDTLTEQVMIPEITGASLTNTITFQSATGDSSDVLITFTPVNTANRYTIRLDGADYIIFKNLSVSSGEEWGWPVELRSKATHNIFEGNKIFMVMQASKNDDYALVYAKGTLDSSNVFIGNHFENGSIGIHLEDCASGIEIVNNSFTNISYKGIYLRNLNKPEIIGNNIDISTTFSGAVGIYLWGGVHTDDPGLIANNMILINTSGGQAYGISVLYCSNISIIYNTVKINADAYSFYTQAFSGYQGNNYDILNNIFVLNQGGYAAVVYDTTDCNIDYNLYYHPNTNYADMYWSNHTSDLEQYGFDLHSISREPEFISDTDLHTVDPWISNMGTPLTEVTTDIDEEVRSLSHPDIGADEYEAEILFSGEYTIGAGGDFETFTRAVDSITEVGAIGSVIFNVMPGIYNEQVIIPAIPHLMDTITVTFQSETGDSADVKLTYHSTTPNLYTILLDSADYIRFENISIENTDSNSMVIVYRGGAENNIISNCHIYSPSIEHSLVFSDDDKDNNNQFFNNYFLNGGFGIHFYGIDGDNEEGTVIENNTFMNQYHASIKLQYQSNAAVSANYVKRDSINSQYYGMLFQDANNLTVTNNMLSLHATSTSTIAGIFPWTVSSSGFYHNTVNIYGKGSSTNCRAINIQDSPNNSISLYNNILVNMAGGLLLYANPVSALNSDFNNLYNNGSIFTATNEVTYSSMEEWQLVGCDGNSLTLDPLFVSDLDLHIGQLQLFGKGMPIPEITDDFDGDSRDVENPTMGADVMTGTCTELLSGVIHVGSGETYQTVNDAVAALILCGMEGTVVFEMAPGTYNEQVLLPENYTGKTLEDSIIFRSATGNAEDVIITYDASQESNYVIKLDGLDNFVLKNITVKAQNSQYGRLIEIENHVNNSLFDGNIFKGIETQENNDSLVLVYYYPESVDSSQVFLNNTFVNGSKAIVKVNSSPKTDVLEILNNRFTNQGYGICTFKNFHLILFEENTVSTNTSIFRGLEGGMVDSLSICRNRVNAEVQEGIFLDSYAKTIFMANNFISFESFSNKSLNLINVDNEFYCYHNTMVISGNNPNSNVYYNSGTNNYSIELKNNVAVNLAGGKVFDFYHNLPNCISDHNNLFTNGEILGKWAGTSYQNLPDYASATGYDANSVSANPAFLSDSTWYSQHVLHSNAGKPISGIADDLDGNTRDAITPDIGAEEFEDVRYSLGEDLRRACAGDQLILDAGIGFDRYEWSIGSDSSSVLIDTVGIGTALHPVWVQVEVNENIYSDTLQVAFQQPEATPVTDYCFNAGTDSILISAGEGVSYRWSTRDTAQSFYVSTGSYFYVTVTDDLGCVDAGEIRVHYNTSCVADLNLQQEITLAYNDSIILQANRCSEMYRWYDYFWTGGDTTFSLNFQGASLGEGTHTIGVRVVNQSKNNCQTVDSVTIIVEEEVGIDLLLSDLAIQIYPNPVQNGRLWISDPDETIASIALFDSRGAKLMQSPLETAYVDMENLPVGVYMLQIWTNNGGILVKKIMLE